MIKNKQVFSFLIPTLLFVLNFILKMLYLDYRDINLDEAFTIFNSQKDLKSLFQIFINENNPPFHFILVHYGMYITKLSVFGLRITSLIISASTVVIIYKNGLKFFNKHIAILSSLIFSFSTFHVLFSHEIRVYPLFCLLTALIIYQFLSIIKNPGQLKNYLLLALYNVILIYSHYLGFVLLFTQLSAVVIFHSGFKFFKRLIITYSIVLLSFLPIAIIFITRLKSFVSQGTWVHDPNFSELYGNLNRFLNNRLSTGLLIIILIVGIIILLARKQLKPKITELLQNRYNIILLYFFIIPYLGMFIISKIGFSMFIDRYILFTSIPFFVIISIILWELTLNHKSFYILSFALLLAMVFHFDLNPDNNRRVRELTNEVKKLHTKGTPLLICPDYFDINLMFYHDQKIFKDYENFDSLMNNNSIYPVNNFNNINSDILESNRIIFVDAAADFSYPNNNIIKELNKRYSKLTRKEFKQDLFIYYFDKRKKSVASKDEDY